MSLPHVVSPLEEFLARTISKSQLSTEAGWENDLTLARDIIAALPTVDEEMQKAITLERGRALQAAALNQHTSALFNALLESNLVLRITALTTALARKAELDEAGTSWPWRLGFWSPSWYVKCTRGLRKNAYAMSDLHKAKVHIEHVQGLLTGTLSALSAARLTLLDVLSPAVVSAIPTDRAARSFATVERLTNLIREIELAIAS